jgi:UDP-N-acetylmuramyl pentapeptide phosphotransferase/UDP-N-acetylglucosamine-1-phosphate transferase
MNSVGFVGVLLLALGLLAFVVPVPHRENHSVRIGDTKIDVQTQHSEKLPPCVGVVLLVGGVAGLVLGARKT